MTSRRAVSVMGSTGSIGCSALDVIQYENQSGGAGFDVIALTAGSNVEKLAEQALECRPQIAVIADETQLPILKDRLAGSGIEAAGGAAAVTEAATRPARVLAAIVGAAGLESTLAAVQAGNDVAIANKESVVCGGRLILEEARKAGVMVLPVDSEHSAIHQCLGDGKSLERLTITASGGPFRTATLDEMRTASPEAAAAHPNWAMGIKNSIDSATLMNKALELIEAAYLFDVPANKIDVIIHPQSIIHGMAHFTDGSVIAQLGAPDMRTPISYALGWPDRVATTVNRLDLVSLAKLDFEAVDGTKFPAVDLAREAFSAGPGATTVLNCANETAVSAFIAGQCGFLDISWVVKEVLSRFLSGNMAGMACSSLEEIGYLDRFARSAAGDVLKRAPGGGAEGSTLG
ncbi:MULTISPECIES: 1-deoxy-D-xylulose-5-phosphate reductoisomerase [unclassified Hyphomonas]|uniref:1-deoxy-D-xylulose-5-phosphate reductoisomerase n=2 Tax=Hyphomonas TaxID=85 RepID=UPI00068B1308|nr:MULTISPECIES: 1-deoxy-D-xylulose-5-phosphate reductoisomerase [unclassified Hyphomonas]